MTMALPAGSVRRRPRSLPEIPEGLSLGIILLGPLVALALFWGTAAGLAPPPSGQAATVQFATRDANVEEFLKGLYALEDCYAEKPDSIALVAAAWAVLRDKGFPPPAKAPPPPRLHGSAGLAAADLRDAMLAAGASVDRQLVGDMLAAMAASLNDDHTAFLDPRQWAAAQRGLTVGFGLQSVPHENGQLVWDVLPGTPAERAGIRPGDVIIAADDMSVSTGIFAGRGWPVQEREMQLKLLRDGSELELSLAPAAVAWPVIDVRLLSGGTVYVRLYSFRSRDVREVGAAVSAVLSKLDGAGPTGWILDLRNNPGGYPEVVGYMAGMLGFKGRLAEVRGRRGRYDIDATGTSITEGRPLAILVNERSASAAEVLSGALKMKRLGRVIGTRTAARVSFVSSFEVAGGALQVATGRVYLTGQKQALGKTGVEPDEVVLLDPAGLSAGRDAQLERAVEYIKAQQSR